MPPVLVRPHSEGDCSITGGYVVRAPDLPSLGGRYVHADFCTGVLRSAVLQAGSAQGDAPAGLTVANASSFGEDSRAVSTSSRWGAVFRLTESPAPVVPCVAPPPPPPPRHLLRLPPPPPPFPTSCHPPAAAARAGPADTTPPETTFVRGPAARTTNRRVTIVAGSEQASLECSLDGGAFAACTMPFTTPRLTEGPHRLELRAVNTAGNIEPRPSAWAWTVDLNPLRRWDMEVLVGRLTRAVRSGQSHRGRARASRSGPHLGAAPDGSRASAGGRHCAGDVGPPHRPRPRLALLRPLAITARFDRVSLTRRVGRLGA